MTKPKTLFGLPEEVRFCRKCVMSNQRPSSYPEFKHTKDRITPTLHIDDDDVCDACRYNEQKKVDIDWKAREEKLMQLCDQHRRNDGAYDCIVPGSGGKDSCLAAHTLKYKYGMNPLTVTWPPIMYTDYGYKNFRNWIEVGGFDNITFNQNGRAHKLLTKLAIENLLHPFQTFILGQKNLAPKIALEYDISLIFYGEPEAEYGNPIAETSSSLRDKSYYSMKNIDDLYLGGVSIKELMEVHGLRLNELATYFPAEADRLAASNIEVHYLGYYVPWTPQEAYYYAVENTGFKARPFRTQGTYSKYNSIDDKIDDLHYYTTYIKFGIGRTTYDASQEIRNKHLTREEGVALVHKYDGEFPDVYFNEIMDYIGITPEQFHELCDAHRSPHLWEKVNGEWKLKHVVENL
ncbi:N-acetyl sugar amidotransferase [Pseudodesulfovibrio sediminis]|uniref:LPS biosynthesis protein PseA n=1 Tax=Pseudodesulfovibrio sediminis TaxID=2810563 RepID=A0ABM7P3V9_9BACT|nr:N-acetyl sugar amidotransferase [Pseudodesulfovibrio sediminis]BCS87551.1 LPS biosynthesis protein PseA [Pseudodesulfovibrio sediminis]